MSGKMRRERLKSGWSPWAIFISSLVLLLLLAAWPLAAGAQTQQPGATLQAQVPFAAPETLPKVLADSVASLQEKSKTMEAQVAESAKNLARTQADLDNLQVAVASLKAVLVVKKPPLFQVQDLITTYQKLEGGVKDASKMLDQEIADLTRQREADQRAQNTLRVQMEILQTREPAPLAREMQPPYLQYLQLAGVQDRLWGQVLHNLQQQRQTWQQESELLAGVLPQLQKLEEDWKAELLKRPAQAISLPEQVADVLVELKALPGKAWQWLVGLLESGRLGAFFRTHLTHLLGLLGFIVLLGWGARRLDHLVARRFHTWRAQTEDLDLLPLYLLGQILVSNLFPLGVILWVGLFFWIFGMLISVPAQLILSILAAWWALRLTGQCVRNFFAGQPAGGVLALDAGTARFYRRSLQVFLAYLFLGILALRIASSLGFPEANRIFLEHLFLVMILAWVLWFLRRPHLPRLLPELHDPAWLHRPWVVLGFRSAVAFSLALIILSDLLGFQNLAAYLAQAVTWTLLAMLVFWFLWLAAETVMYHLLHPETGWARERFPEKGELLQRLFHFSRWALSLILGAGVALWSLDLWGIKPAQVAWAFQWLDWGPTLGPVKLTTLHAGGAIMALYLGFWVSRLLRSLMAMRIFPRTALDHGVRYTIATTVHYVVLVLAGLIALNVLGFPLTNLALVAGALGVGIGFGLQNIVNNFLSGLILLFERPIKVGDMLVIDGQWGTVKEIRVRSTIFETFDRYVLIIPNSELISSKVLNWTHYGRGVNRLTLKVGVGYGSDVKQVTQLLTAICRANPRVVAEPPPEIYFAAYGDSSLDFTIWVHVKTPNDRVPATHELNSAIFETFQQHGIEIPFPQRDLHIRQAPEELIKKED